jgi:predicted Rossmann fold nucleotide-binding protein DprA/Smf involved in DNA uptake
VDEPLIEYAEAVGRQCAVAKKGVISGGAQGIDRAAMRGALDAGGRVTGILADSLERTALNRENRSWLLDEQLVLISPYDPSAGFNVGHAMQRNKLIYGLADAALVVTADYEKGGTWTGAVEQLQKLRFVPIYVRSTGEIGRGLEALSTIGARPWPNPRGTDELLAMFDESDVPLEADQRQLTFQTPPVTPEESKGTQMDSSDEIAGNIPKLEKVQEEESTPNGEQGSEIPHSSLCNSPSLEPARMLIECVRDILVSLLRSPKDEGEIAEVLQVTTAQARTWLQKLVDEEVLEKRSRPVRYSVRQKKLL